jgi:hypothetical protein
MSDEACGAESQAREGVIAKRFRSAQFGTHNPARCW